jgi:hypothetical protein
LHEDVNAITKKPYVEYKDANGRADHEVAAEFWNGLLQRDSSIIVDTFYGQLKSRVQCTKCNHVSLSFDPFSILSLPIPNIGASLRIKYFPYDLSKRPIEFLLSVGAYVTVAEIRHKMDKYLN